MLGLKNIKSNWALPTGSTGRGTLLIWATRLRWREIMLTLRTWLGTISNSMAWVAIFEANITTSSVQVLSLSSDSDLRVPPSTFVHLYVHDMIILLCYSLIIVIVSYRGSIDRMDAQHGIERSAAQQEQGDDELLNPRHDAEVATPANRRDCQARFRPERRAMQIPFDDDDDDLDGAGATGAIILPPLAPGANFNITSTMIQLLKLKGLFSGLAGDNPNMHLINFISTCKSFDNPGVG
ncbi:hypothetical protein CQW23_14331 [Capsicum baccatum]|uniref:Uncharacterized protein n=1 Tax=Capsicum baccatum TaxID=33114 RepID=A0A2G2WIV9_CAPBA|nr:hypothetical protein CQW23_14331 [Capsicum baccatum]